MSPVRSIKLAFRQLWKHPGFSVAAVVTLAVGIAASTSVFSLVDAILLRPLPFPHSERLVSLDTVTSSGANRIPNANGYATSYPDFFDWRNQAKSFQGLACYREVSRIYQPRNGAAQRIAGDVVSADFFNVLDVSPALGRTFMRDDEQKGNRHVVISSSFWQSTLGGAPVLGRMLQLSDDSYTIIGVLPSTFRFPGQEGADFWISIAADRDGSTPPADQRGFHQLNVIARLRPEMTIAQSRAEMQQLQGGIAKLYPEVDFNHSDVRVQTELEAVVGNIRRPLQIILAGCLFLLMIAGANVAGLLLAHLSNRQGELALRVALGASRARIIKQLLVEFLILSLTSGVAGIALSYLVVGLAPKFLPADLPRLGEIGLNPPVVAFALALAALIGLIFGVLPAFALSSLTPASLLRSSSRGSTAGAQQQTLQNALVVGQTALSLVLLVGSGLLIRSFVNLMHVDPGFRADHLLTFRLAVPFKHFSLEQETRFYQQLTERLHALPGVSAATYGFPLPLTKGDVNISFDIAGHPFAKGDKPSARISTVAPSFFAAMQIPILRGRAFTDQDNRVAGPPLIIVNQAFVAKYLQGQEPLGALVRADFSQSSAPPPFREVVGVVANVKRSSLSEETEPEYYLPYSQAALTAPPFAIRTVGDPARYSDTVMKLVADMDSSLPIFAVRTYPDLLAQSTARQRFQTSLLASFAFIALFLAAIGLYSILNYMVELRSREIALRLALGASKANIFGLIFKRGAMLITFGVVVGLAVAASLSHFIQAQMYKTHTYDPVAFLATPLILFVISLFGGIGPAYKASALDPNDALRRG